MNVTVTALIYNSTLWLSEICCTVQTLSCRLVFQKREKLGHNLQCYMFIHPPGADSLCSLPSLFPTSEPLCGRLPTEREEKYLLDQLISLQANNFIYYLPINLPIISKLPHLPLPPWATQVQMPRGLPEGCLWEGW